MNRSGFRRSVRPFLVVLAGVLPALAVGAASATAQDDATKHVAIVNQDMTDEQIKAAIEAEGYVTVGNWTYSANDVIQQEFQKYVKDTYGVDAQLIYEGTQQPNLYLTKLKAAKLGGDPAPYDVIAVEENYWADAMTADLVDSFLPSDLVPNQELVLEQFQRVPTSIAFQSTAFPAIVYNKATAPELTSLMDLADPAFAGRITMPQPGDITMGGLMLGFAAELKKDYKDPAQMKEVVDWVVDNIAPNVTQWTTDQATPQQLLETGAVDAVGFWNSMARLEFLGGNSDITLLVPQSVYPANGYLWIPKGAQHPVLAQIFIDWRLSKEAQFPNAWTVEGEPMNHGWWSELSEGFLGPAYEDQIPDWFQADYFSYYPTLQQIQDNFKSLDWDAYNASAAEWQPYFLEKLGL